MKLQYITSCWQICEHWGWKLWRRIPFPVLLPQLPGFWCPTHSLLPNKVCNSLSDTPWCFEFLAPGQGNAVCQQRGCHSQFWFCPTGRLQYPWWSKWWLTSFQACIWTSKVRDTKTKREGITWWRQSTRVHTCQNDTSLYLPGHSPIKMSLPRAAQLWADWASDLLHFRSGIQHWNLWNAFLNM